LAYVHAPFPTRRSSDLVRDETPRGLEETQVYLSQEELDALRNFAARSGRSGGDRRCYLQGSTRAADGVTGRNLGRFRRGGGAVEDRKSTRLNSSHQIIS